MRRLRSAVAALRQDGFSGAADLLRSNLYVSGACLRLRLDLVSLCATERPRAERLAEAGGTLDYLVGCRDAWSGRRLPSDFFADRIYGLRRFHLGFCDGKLAGILWLAGRGEASTVSNSQPAAREVEVRNVCTLPLFRRRGLFRVVIVAALRAAREQGITVAYAHVDEPNDASMQAFLGVGFRPTHRLEIKRILGMDAIREVAIAA